MMLGEPVQPGRVGAREMGWVVHEIGRLKPYPNRVTHPTTASPRNSVSAAMSSSEARPTATRSRALVFMPRAATATTNNHFETSARAAARDGGTRLKPFRAV